MQQELSQLCARMTDPAKGFLEKASLCLSDTTLVLKLSTRYATSYLVDNHDKQIKAILTELVPSAREVVLLHETKPSVLQNLQTIREVLKEAIPINPARVTFASSMTFDSLSKSRYNALAHSAVTESCTNLLPQYNPIIISGPHGYGKTHLLHAAANRAVAANKKVVFFTAEEFTNEYLRNLASKTLDKFRTTTRSAEVFILDGLQFLSGKLKTQQELLFAVKTIRHNDKQVLISSLPSLNLSKELEEFCASGLTAKLCDPTLEERAAILKTTASNKGWKLPPEAINKIATVVSASPGLIIGAMSRVVASANALGEEITERFTINILAEAGFMRAGPPTMEEVLRTIVAVTGISPELIISSQRHAPIITARHIAMFFCRKLTTHSWAEIGAFFGQRDHTSVMHAVRKIKLQQKSIPATAELLRKVSDTLDAGTRPITKLQ